MERRANGEEELIVPAKGTADTSDKDLIVGCTCTYGTSADITGALRSGEAVNSTLEPGRSIRISSSERSYQIVLLSVEHGEVRVRVISTQIEKPEQAEKTASRVSVLETKTSCFAALQRIVDLIVTSEKVKVKWDREGFRIVDKGFFGATLLRLSSIHFLQNGRRGQLFWNGSWENLRIEVFTEPYLAIAKTIAEAYTEQTNKEVSIVKEF